MCDTAASTLAAVEPSAPPPDGTVTIAIVSDIHYASAGEQARRGHESRAIANPVLRRLAGWYRHYVWLRDPLAHNPLLDRFITAARGADWVVANGDYSCDTAFVGVSDDAVFTSVDECLGKLREAFPGRLAASLGDHELGKMSLFGGQGGLRLASWERTITGLALEPFWRLDFGRWVLIGVTSSLVALSVFEPETLPAELPEWRRLREHHIASIRAVFRELAPEQRVLLFCHDPSALPFLWREGIIRSRLAQVAATVIGHLHTGLVFRLSRVLAGMPRIAFLGNTVRRLSEALQQARCWRDFRVRLCPSLTGCELLKDGGYCTVTFNPAEGEWRSFTTHPMPRA